MKMPARLLFGGAAGMKDCGPLRCRDAGKFQFLERAGGHSRDLRPMLDDFGRHSSSPANLLVGGIALELEGKEFESEGFKFPEGRVTRAPILNS